MESKSDLPETGALDDEALDAAAGGTRRPSNLLSNNTQPPKINQTVYSGQSKQPDDPLYESKDDDDLKKGTIIGGIPFNDDPRVC